MTHQYWATGQPHNFAMQKLKIVVKGTPTDGALHRRSGVAGQAKGVALPTPLGEQFLPVPPAPCTMPHAVLQQDRSAETGLIRLVDNSFDAVLDGVCDTVGHQLIPRKAEACL